MVSFLESKVEILGFYHCFLFGSLGLQVNGITFDVHCLDGADELASAASYAKGLDGACGAYLAAQVAVIVAVTFVKLHDRLHDAAQSVLHTCRFENV